ncbi:MAG TPA: choice-of-anchor Q domain-containing protein [Rudaea sp.]
MSRHRFLATTAALAAFLICAAAHPATFCISDATQLAPALLAAQSNGEDDTIYIEVGTYLPASELGYFAPSDETYRLSIYGGVAPGCQSGYASSGSTTLDGQNAHRILTISAYGEVDIGRITFQHASPPMYFGAALNIGNNGHDTYLFSDAFVANKTAAGYGGGAVYLASQAQGDIFVWSSLFVGNTSSAGAIYVNGSGNTYLTGNTIIANQLINDSGLAGGIDLAGLDNVWLSNNIVWNNDNNDVYDQAGHARYSNNDIGKLDGFAPLSAVNELNVDPDFDGFFSTRLAPGSPLVNAGTDAAPGGIGGCCDAGGATRLQGKHVDIGAYETDVLFRDGFGA